MLDNKFIEKTIEFVKSKLIGFDSGHDWWHIQRVWQNAIYINQFEKGNPEIVMLGALLHDIADAKFHDGDEKIGPKIAREYLKKNHIDDATIEQVTKIIDHISYKSNLGQVHFKSKELDIVQDADRLDAMGAIGIARAFHYGGFKNREIYNPDIPSAANISKEEYKKSNAPTINHFYEKLLLLKDKMNTKTGKQLAEGRHQFLEQYLDQFFSEWYLDKKRLPPIRSSLYQE